ncbi:MAG: hypothetical protein ACK559_36520, partial [bacterium]
MGAGSAVSSSVPLGAPQAVTVPAMSSTVSTAGTSLVARGDIREECGMIMGSIVSEGRAQRKVLSSLRTAASPVSPLTVFFRFLPTCDTA